MCFMSDTEIFIASCKSKWNEHDSFKSFSILFHFIWCCCLAAVRKRIEKWFFFFYLNFETVFLLLFPLIVQILNNSTIISITRILIIISFSFLFIFSYFTYFNITTNIFFLTIFSFNVCSTIHKTFKFFLWVIFSIFFFGGKLTTKEKLKKKELSNFFFSRWINISLPID